MAIVTPRWDATPPGVRQAYMAVSSVLRGSDFYLAGGTALALLEAHRLSADLDFFAPAVDRPEALAERVAAGGLETTILSTAPGTLYLLVGGVQVSFIATGYPLLAPLLDAGDDLLPLASRDDLAAMKLAAIASRGSRKDFVDIWVLASRHRSLGEYLALYRRKYGADDAHVLRSLVYFDDADREPPLRMLAEISWDEVKADIRSWVAALLA